MLHSFLRSSDSIACMTPAEIEAALREAFAECELASFPLTETQKQILLRILNDRAQPATSAPEPNPLDDLTLEQRQVFLSFIEQQRQQNRSWKAKLLNDWLQGQNSGEMQFIRELYGLPWLERVQPVHIAQYAEEVAMVLKVGDRIEVSNGLWEWVQEDDPQSQEWFPCTVIQLTDASSPAAANRRNLSCTVRFDNGMEYEIQGVYDWNRYNWRWAGQTNQGSEM